MTPKLRSQSGPGNRARVLERQAGEHMDLEGWDELGLARCGGWGWGLGSGWGRYLCQNLLLSQILFHLGLLPSLRSSWVISCSLASLAPMSPHWARVGVGSCLLSITWLCAGTPRDLYRIELIPLHRLLLSCPPLGSYLLTTLHQWPNLAPPILSVCLIHSTLPWPHCCSRIFVYSYCAASSTLIHSAAPGIALKRPSRVASKALIIRHLTNSPTSFTKIYCNFFSNVPFTHQTTPKYVCLSDDWVSQHKV